MSRRRKRMTFEDQILWHRVARTATPLPGHVYPDDPEMVLPEEVVIAESTAVTVFTQLNTPIAPVVKPVPKLERLDVPTHKKLARERLPIDARIDLHGMTQDEAYSVLLGFLQRARVHGKRHVLVITGKGNATGGVLRRTVPKWLSTQPFSGIVGAYEDAARHHGGEGAIYVRLRRIMPQ